MSYDLYFWKQVQATAEGPGQICGRLIEHKPCDAVVAVPAGEVASRLLAGVPDIELVGQEDGKPARFMSLERPPETWAVTVEWSAKLFTVHSYGAPGSVLNEFIDVFLELGMPLYDPQTGRRYDGD